VKLSIVTTLYKSEQYIEEFHKRVTSVAKQLVDESYEIIFVNDGSPDNSLDVALRVSDSDPHSVIVDLSRNFGHHKAMMTGLSYSNSENVYLIDVDLEEDPEWLHSFLEQMNRDKCDVVFGVQETRKGKFFERLSGKIFYWLLNKITGLAVPENLVTARVMSQRYVKALLLHEEREVFMAGLWNITGFKQQAQKVVKHSRGTTTYTLRKKLSLFVNSVTSFSNAPLIGIFYTGVFILVMAGGYTFYLLMLWMFFTRPLSGWTSMMASVWLLGGMMISFMGVIGIYLSKIFSETKRRPYVIVRNVYGRKTT